MYRGETFIENVERLPDGTSHLLLRIDDDNELIDSKNPNKARGRYKYRFKRVTVAKNLENSENNKQSDESDTEQEVVESLNKGLADIREESASYRSDKSITNSKTSIGSIRKEASKSKHFIVDEAASFIEDPNRSFESDDLSGMIVRSVDVSEDDYDDDDDNDDDTDTEDEINVANENFVTKMTKEKEKK